MLLLLLAIACSCLGATVHSVRSQQELARVQGMLENGDTIVFERAGIYGKLVLFRKDRIRVMARSPSIPIGISIVVDQSKNVEIVSMFMTPVRGEAQMVLGGPTSTDLTIRSCKFSSDTRGSEFAPSGIPALRWVSAIRLLGKRSMVVSNIFVSVRWAINGSGEDGLVASNRIRFFSEDAIRVTGDRTQVLYNIIADSVKTGGDGAHLDAIQLIPAENRFSGGVLRDVRVEGNRIRNAERLPQWQQGILQGIFGSDGYFVNCIISRNFVMVNSDHGISLNGVSNLRAESNRIIDTTPADNLVPGIKFYYSRHSSGGQQRWIASKHYSVFLRGNQAPVLNVPDRYSANVDRSNNFGERTNVANRGGIIVN